MKRFIITLLVAGLLIIVTAAIVPAQPLHGDLSGVLGPGTLEVDGDCFIQDGVTVEISSGTEFVFLGPYKITVYGEIFAWGVSGNPIVFTSDSTDNPDGWRGLRFRQASPISRLGYCIIENSRAEGEAPNSYGGGVYLNCSDLTFDHCTFRNNSARNGGGMYAYNSDITLTGCTFTSNHATNIGGGIYSSGCDIEMEECIIDRNTADAQGGGCFVFNSTPSLINCTIVGNSSPEGAGIYNNRCSINLLNTILCGSMGSEGLNSQSGSHSLVNYCLFHDNEGGNFTGSGVHRAVGINIWYNTNMDSCDLYNNVFLDSYLADPDSADYSLSRHSPCINAGDQTVGNDPDGTFPDIGAYAYTHEGASLRVREPYHDFGIVPVDSSVTWIIPVMNTGYEDLVIEAVSASPDVYVPEEIIQLTLTPGQGDSIEITFTPPDGAEYEGVITISSNDPVNGEVEIEVYGDGEGIEFRPDCEFSVPDEYSIVSVYPNPFNPSTTITVGLAEPAGICVNVYNIAGKKVSALADGRYNEGYHKFTFNACDLAAGIYFIQVVADSRIEARKAVLIK